MSLRFRRWVLVPLLLALLAWPGAQALPPSAAQAQALPAAVAEAPKGITAVAPTAPGGSDGALLGVSVLMEYMPVGVAGAAWTICTGEAQRGLPAGAYLVRYRRYHAQAPSPYIAVSVPLCVACVTLQPGSNETEMNFAWYAGVHDPLACEVQLLPCPEGTQPRFAGSGARVFTGEAGQGKKAVYNRATVTGLQANTRYAYRLGDGIHFSESNYFVTRDATKFSAIVVGDPQIGGLGRSALTAENWRHTVDRALAAFPKVSFILSVGDHVERSSDEDLYSAFFSAPQLAGLPLAPAVGNHDEGYLFSQHFNPPNNSQKYGKSWASGDYWFTYGNTLFMVLNSINRYEEQHDRFMGEAIQQAGPGIVWKIVMFHHSIYSSGSHSGGKDILARRADMVPIFDRYGIDMVLMGHDHCYTRTYQMDDDRAVSGAERAVLNPKGTVYITLNSAAGSKMYELRPGDKAYRAVHWQGYVPSYSVLWVGPRSLSITTYETESHAVVDAYTIMKTPQAAPAPAPTGSAGAGS